MTIPADDPRHGKRSGYLAGCRQQCCIKANATWVKAYRYRASKAGGSTTLDAAPVREHLLKLSEAMSLSSIHIASGVSRSSVRRIRLGEIKRIHPKTARALLAVKPYAADVGKHYVDARGTRRRLQALHALGYPMDQIERITGFSKTNLSKVIYGHRSWVTGDTAEKVRAAYEAACMRLPDSPDRIVRGHITKARERARSLGWAPPLAWDDIDRDPAPHMPRGLPASQGQHLVDHAVVQRVADGEPKPRTLTRAEAAEVVRILRARGLSEYEINQRGFKAERYEREAS